MKKFNKEHKKNLSLAKIGNKNPMWGRKHTAESIKKMSENKCGEKCYNYGKKLPLEARKK